MLNLMIFDKDFPLLYFQTELNKLEFNNSHVDTKTLLE